MKVRLLPVFAVATLSGTAAFSGGYVAPIVAEPTIVPLEVNEPLTWKGWYAGGTIGYAFAGDDEVGYARNDNVYNSPDELELAGVNGGVRIGYRTQFTGRTRDWVIGGELAYEGGNIEDDFNEAGFAAESSINSVLGLRVKTGVLNTAKNTLFYGILGVAQADLDYSIDGIDRGASYSVDTEGETMTGYVVGLGVERRVNERLSVTGEWEYANFGKETLGGDDFPYSTEMTPDFHNIKIGLNYQF